MSASLESSGAAPDLFCELALALVPGVGPRLRQALLDRFGSAAAVLAASTDEIRTVPGVGVKVAAALLRARQETSAAEILELCGRENIRLYRLGEPDYPRLLAEIHDPPAILFTRGELLPQDAVAVAIVGTRHATRYGLTQAEKLAGNLARAGVTIVSGLARGIDAAAHRGALAAGGRTLAVLGCGLLNVYPPEHEPLAAEVAGQGAVLSELPPRFPTLREGFPRRNRLVSGLVQGVIVVEAPENSGALITARHAAEQGRDVFAVPGPIDSRASRGCHALLRDGAKLVASAEDVLSELGPLVEPARDAGGQTVHRPAELLLNDVERQVLAALDGGPQLIDEVIAGTGLPAARVLATLSVLQMRHLVRRLPGNQICRS